MATEIERKFLVTSDEYKHLAFEQEYIKQAYLSTHPERSVRIRLKNKTAFLTVKGLSSDNGLSRFEWEKEISVLDASELFKLCEPGAIAKIRYKVRYGDVVIEIDEFFEDNLGLVMAEVELISESQEFEKPTWFGKEVTGDKRYYNAMLTKKPFRSW